MNISHIDNVKFEYATVILLRAKNNSNMPHIENNNLKITSKLQKYPCNKLLVLFQPFERRMVPFAVFAL